MKARHLLKVAGVSLFAFALAGAGALAAKPQKAEPVAADGETWMINATFKAKEILEWDGVGINSFVFRCGMDGQDGWAEKTMSQSGVEGLYTVNLPLAEDFEFNRIQVKFTQNGETKWSNPYAVSGSKESHQGWYGLTYSSWDSGDNFNVSANTYVTGPSFKYNNVSYVLEEDPAHSRYIYRNFVVDEVGSSIYYILYWAMSYDYTMETLTTSTLNNYFSEKGWELNDSWCCMGVTGTYDVIFKDNGNDGGVVEFKLHSEDRNYIYLVGGDITGETALYTFGEEDSAEEFGAFPGKKLKNIDDAQEIHGDLKFQGQECNIWRVEVDMYYPAADHLILSQLNEYGVVGTQTADMRLVRYSAYWFSDEAEYHNDLAGSALSFLFEAEAVRKAASDQSVCDVSKAEAEALVSTYNSLGSFMQETYIDCTTVNTWSDSTRTAKSYVSYRAVMEQLAAKAEMTLPGASRYISTNNNNANITTVIIVLVVSLSLVSVTTLIVIRRRKHQ